METAAVIIVFLLLVQDLLLLLLLQVNFRGVPNPQGPWPTITLLIPCRNEEKNLPYLLASLEKLDYPEDKLQLVLGDDHSEDQTLEMLLEWSRDKSFLQVMEIAEGDGLRINGKANALAQMAKQANGEYLLFTDADCEVPTTWLKSMVWASRYKKADLVTGVTAIRGKTRMAAMQALDWWLTLGLVKIASDLGSSVTSMGNNMLIRKAAYEAVGGFEGIPFSLTEDFQMAKSLEAKGFCAFHLVSEGNLIFTKAQETLKGLLQQRKRWMAGAMSLPFLWRLLLFFQVVFFPAISLLAFLHPFEGLLLWLFKVIIQALFIYGFALKTMKKLNLFDLLVFEIYYLLTAWSTIVYYFWPSKTVWKGRKY